MESLDGESRLIESRDEDDSRLSLVEVLSKVESRDKKVDDILCNLWN